VILKALDLAGIAFSTKNDNKNLIYVEAGKPFYLEETFERRR